MQVLQTCTNLEDFEKASRGILTKLAKDRNELRKLVLAVTNDIQLFSLCEHYDILDKIVLWISDDHKFRLRLHVFADDYYDRPHNHRWSYSSFILTGGYRHTIFMLNEDRTDPSSQHLLPVIIRQEEAGDFYTLHFSQYHSVVAQPNTVTLVMRGAPEQERFRVMDRVTNEAWWQYGASQENEQEKSNKKMDRTRLEFLITKLEKMGVI